MRMSSESRRIRWTLILIAWFLTGSFTLIHAWQVHNRLQYSSHLERSEESRESPLLLLNYFPALDGKTWVRYAIQLAEKPEEWRLRYTYNDNAPNGREIHWSSAWAWWLVALGAVNHIATGNSWPHAIENMSVWANVPVLLLGIAGFSIWMARRAGGLAALLTALCFIGHPQMYQAFRPAYPDHHGLLNLAVFGLLLGVIFAGAGWWHASDSHSVLPRDKNQMRRAITISAICGAVGMWISAASLVVPIAEVGLAGLIMTVVLRRQLPAAGFQFDPSIWRLWGRVGGTCSLLFYLLEYAPHHLGMQLQANHPLYALAWWGGAEIVASITEYSVAKQACLQPDPVRRAARLLFPLLAVLAAPAAIIFGPVNWFNIRDPFLSRLHHHITEFLPIWSMLKLDSAIIYLSMLVPIIAAIILYIRSNAKPENRLILGLLIITSMLLTLQGCLQTRWSWISSGTHIILLVIVLCTYFNSLPAGINLSRRCKLVLATCLVLYGPWPALELLYGGKWTSFNSQLALEWITRDIARTICESTERENIILLSDPNTSSEAGYFGRLKTVGTLYWENLEGLKAAGAIFAAYSDDEAGKLIRERGITHFVLIDNNDFIPEYHTLIHPEDSFDTIKNTFAARILKGHEPPLWLRPIPYSKPPQLEQFEAQVMIFKVDFEQNPADAHYNLAEYHLSLKETDRALQHLKTSLDLNPKNADAWLRMGEIEAGKHQIQSAAADFRDAITQADASRHGHYAANAGMIMDREGAVRDAIAFYREALSAGFKNPLIANNLAWRLATAKEEDLRQPSEALQLAEWAVANSPRPELTATLAAALAAAQRFPEAIATAEQAVAAARSSGDEKLVERLQLHLEAYRARHLWQE